MAKNVLSALFCGVEIYWPHPYQGGRTQDFLNRGLNDYSLAVSQLIEILLGRGGDITLR